ncbi:MAG TPA: hypothetical protein VKT49_09110 [Bryobacteraceae bacterium]|nr:hypothetical protein [Bryobacteraceae bacterium]
MQREFQQGYLERDFPAPPFDSPSKLLRRSAQLYFSHFGFLAALTLLVFLPAKLALQLVSYWLDVPKGGLAAYLTMDLSDLVLSSLAVPAAIYGLLEGFRAGKAAPAGRALRWGLRQWGKTLWNQFKVEITITLWGALFIIPGIVAMVRLIFTATIVAIEGDGETAVLERSRDIARGQGWRIFAVLVPVMIVEFAGPFLALNAIGGANAPRPVIALVDALLSVGGQWSTVIVLLMYLGLVPAGKQAATGRAQIGPSK